MNRITVDFAETRGPVKPMNAVNNGPLVTNASQQNANFRVYAAARFPYARNHDAAFCENYGGPHTVDIQGIFPDFSADPEDPASYDFTLTDRYLLSTLSAGTKIFYRLGHRIEHNPKKYGTLPPPDFQKWAVICAHVIRHMNEGWANGHRMEIEYWEIWNEPDLDRDDSSDKKCWGGTKAQFFDFYEIVAKHLKGCFPRLKIGGPALASHMDWAEDFLAEMRRRQAPLDFFSWHRYSPDPRKILQRALETRALMERYGYGEAESILNEWNYVRSFHDDEWIYSLKQMQGRKGASFAAAVMALCQYAPVDMLMYYDARPGGMNGLFSTEFPGEVRPAYAPFYAFADLRELGAAAAVQTEPEAPLFAVAAADGHGCAGVLLTYFSDDDDAAPLDAELLLKNCPASRLACRRLNDGALHPLLGTTVRGDAALSLRLAPQDILFITLRPAE